MKKSCPKLLITMLISACNFNVHSAQNNISSEWIKISKNNNEEKVSNDSEEEVKRLKNMSDWKKISEKSKINVQLNEHANAFTSVQIPNQPEISARGQDFQTTISGVCVTLLMGTTRAVDNKSRIIEYYPQEAARFINGELKSAGIEYKETYSDFIKHIYFNESEIEYHDNGDCYEKYPKWVKQCINGSVKPEGLYERYRYQNGKFLERYLNNKKVTTNSYDPNDTIPEYILRKFREIST